MHHWRIAPDARQHLDKTIADAFKLGDTVKVEQAPDGTFRVTSPALTGPPPADPTPRPGPLSEPQHPQTTAPQTQKPPVSKHKNVIR